MKKSSNSSREGSLSWALIILLLTIGFFTFSGCDLGTYKKRYDGPEPEKVEPKEAESEKAEPENGEPEQAEAPIDEEVN